MKSHHYSIALLFLFQAVNANPPEDTVKCISGNSNCILRNAYGFPDRTNCHAASVAYPATQEEVISLVANATKMKRKMKVSTLYYHSIGKLSCPGGTDGLIISTNKLNKIIKLDRAAKTVTVEPGVTLRTLIQEAGKSGLTLSSVPYWWGLTIGGLLSTGAHGSTLWRASAVHDYVTSMSIVSPGTRKEGYAKLRVIQGGDSAFDSAKVSIGVLGVISRVTIALEPVFKRSITFEEKSDVDLADTVVEFGKKHEYGDILWFPSQRKATYRMDDRVSITTEGDGVFDYIPFRSFPSADMVARRTIEENLELNKDEDGKCIIGEILSSSFKSSAFGFTNDGANFTGNPVIGFNHRLQSSGSCLDSPDDDFQSGCVWDERLKGGLFFDTGLKIGVSKVGRYIKDIQDLVKLRPQALCGLQFYTGVLIRYVKKSSAALANDEDSVSFDITSYRSNDPKAPRLNEDAIEEIEQMAFFKYGALPHWGKNTPAAFEGVIKKYKKKNEFMKVKRLFDRWGLFSNEWSDEVLGLSKRKKELSDGCALDGICRCSEDKHCAPNHGYYCKRGLVYHQAKVCTFVK